MTTEAAESTAAPVENAPAPEVTESEAPQQESQAPEPVQQEVEEAPTPRNAKKAARLKAQEKAREIADRLSKDQEDRRSSAERREQAAEAARERARGEDGKFLPENEGQTELPPGEVAASEDGGDPASSSTQSNEADSPASGMVRIPLPENHPLQEQGVTYIDAPKGQERTYRTLASAAARRAEVEAANAKLEQMQTELKRREIEAEWYASGEGQLTPREMAVIRDNQRAYGDEVAELVKQGILNRKRESVDNRQKEALREMAVEKLTRNAVTFRQDMAKRLMNEFPGLQPETLNKAFTHYGNHIQTMAAMGQKPELTERGFYDAAGLYLQRDPAVQAKLDARRNQRSSQQQKIAEERAKKEAAQKEEERLREASTRHRQNPKLGAVATGARTAPQGGPEKMDFSGMTPKQIRNAAMERARESARGIVGR